MKRFLVVLVVVVMVLALATPVFAARPDHPKGPDSMPDESVGGLHAGAKEVPEFPQHILRGLMLRTDVDCPH